MSKRSYFALLFFTKNFKPQTMKILMLILACFMSWSTQAQKTFNQTVNAKDAEKVSFDFQFADDINMAAWNKDEVFVEAIVNIDDNKHNDNFQFKKNVIGSQIVIEAEIEDLDKLGEETIVKDKNGDTYVYNSRTVDLDITYKVKVPQNLEVSLKTINGNINTKTLENAALLKTISGDIDISMDDNESFDLLMKTISGDMYTDFEFENPRKKKYYSFNSSIDTEVNGGGYLVELHTISGNIYFRKK